MAVLTNQDYADLRNEWYRSGFGKEELKALPALPSSTQIKAAFQAIEDTFTTAVIPQGAVGMTVIGAIKLQFDSALGVATSQALFISALRVWFRWRDRQGG